MCVFIFVTKIIKSRTRRQKIGIVCFYGTIRITYRPAEHLRHVFPEQRIGFRKRHRVPDFGRDDAVARHRHPDGHRLANRTCARRDAARPRFRPPTRRRSAAAGWTRSSPANRAPRATNRRRRGCTTCGWLPTKGRPCRRRNLPGAAARHSPSARIRCPSGCRPPRSRAPAPCRSQVGRHARRVDQVDLHPGGNRDAVGAVGIVEQREPHAVALHPQRVVGRAVEAVGKDAGMRDAAAPQPATVVCTPAVPPSQQWLLASTAVDPASRRASASATGERKQGYPV